MKTAKVIENDALVVLCFTGIIDEMSHHRFKEKAKSLGFNLTKSQCHNMLHRAKGRVKLVAGGGWKLTASGMSYREAVLDVIQKILHGPY